MSTSTECREARRDTSDSVWPKLDSTQVLFAASDDLTSRLRMAAVARLAEAELSPQ